MAEPEPKIPNTSTPPAKTIAKIKQENSEDAGTSAKKIRTWFLQKFIDDVRTGDPINLSELGFPVPIGRDPHQVKIHMDGPKRKVRVRDPSLPPVSSSLFINLSPECDDLHE